MFCFVLFALQLSVCLWWHDYRRGDFPTLKFGVVIAGLLAIRRERAGALCTEYRPCHMGRRARVLLTPYIKRDQHWLGAEAHSPCQ